MASRVKSSLKSAGKRFVCRNEGMNFENVSYREYLRITVCSYCAVVSFDLENSFEGFLKCCKLFSISGEVITSYNDAIINEGELICFVQSHN